MLVPAACFDDFWCAKYEYCMATSYLPVGGMVTKSNSTHWRDQNNVCLQLCWVTLSPFMTSSSIGKRWMRTQNSLPVLVRTPFWWPCQSHHDLIGTGLQWQDLRSSLTLPWQLHSIHCSQDERGAPFGVWRRQCLENHRHRLEAEEPISWVPRDLEILCPGRPLCHQPKKLRMCPASLRAPWPGLCSGEPLRFARCQDGWEQEGLPSGKRLHNYWKSPFLMGKLTYKSPFSIAMLVIITRGGCAPVQRRGSFQLCPQGLWF